MQRGRRCWRNIAISLIEVLAQSNKCKRLIATVARRIAPVIRPESALFNFPEADFRPAMISGSSFLNAASNFPTDPSHEFREPCVATQPIENGFRVELDQVRIPFLVSFFQLFERLLFVARRGVDLRYVVRQDVALSLQVLQLVNESLCRSPLSRSRVSHRKRGQRFRALASQVGSRL